MAGYTLHHTGHAPHHHPANGLLRRLTVFQNQSARGLSACALRGRQGEVSLARGGVHGNGGAESARLMP